MNRPVHVAHVTTVDLTARFLLLGQLRRLRDEGFEVASVSAPGSWTADLEAEGIRHVPWPHATRAWDPWSDIRAFSELRNIFRRERFDVVHTHNPKPGVLGRVAARLAGTPVVVNTVHGLYATPQDRPSKRLPVLAAERLAALFSDLELYQSEEDLRWARRIGVVRPSRSILLGNGTDLGWFDPEAVSPARRAEVRRELGLPDDAVVVTTVGRLVAEKGYRDLFAASKSVRSRRPGVRFVVVGAPDFDKADAISAGEIEGAGEDVVVAGWRSDIRDVLGASDVFVLPSWREGVPRSAIEAAAMGLPMVLTDIRGCREVVRPGIEGFLVPPRSGPDLAAGIRSLVDDPGLRERMGRAARARAEERFDERRVEDTILAAYRGLLRRKGLPEQKPRQPATLAHLRPATRRDAEAMARLHRDALPEAFLPALGDRFLRRLYRALIADPSAVAVVAENARGVVGFAAGASSVESFFRRFRRRHGIPAAVLAGPRLARRDVRRRLRETSRYPSETADLPPAELLAIAVEPGHTSGGLGTALARDVLDGLSHRGADEVRVTVAASNPGANRFYEGLGFRLARTLSVHRGFDSNVWVIRWPSWSASSPLRS
jgi:glycosyltransferase involved in cell wall biosynthesis/ribosomal protein S18 acetylase RimI-like enzyme